MRSWNNSTRSKEVLVKSQGSSKCQYSKFKDSNFKILGWRKPFESGEVDKVVCHLRTCIPLSVFDNGGMPGLLKTLTGLSLHLLIQSRETSFKMRKRNLWKQL